MSEANWIHPDDRQTLREWDQPLPLVDVMYAQFSVDNMQRMLVPGPLTCIYFIEAPHCAMIKIGRAEDVAQRMSALQCASPEELLLLWCYAAPLEHEAALHRHFRALRSHGEWFRAEHPLTEYIDRRLPGVLSIREGAA